MAYTKFFFCLSTPLRGLTFCIRYRFLQLRGSSRSLNLLILIFLGKNEKQKLRRPLTRGARAASVFSLVGFFPLDTVGIGFFQLQFARGRLFLCNVLQRSDKIAVLLVHFGFGGFASAVRRIIYKPFVLL